MVTDKCDETLLKLASNGIDKRAMAGLVFQVVFSLAMIRHYFPGFSHNDLHLKNVLYRKREAPLTYRYKDREYEITNPEYVAFINDFDFAQLPDVDDNPVVLFHRHRSNASDLFRFLYCIYSKGYPFKFIEKLIDPWLLRSELLHKYIYYTPVRGAFLSENPSPGSKLLMVAAQLMVSASDFERMMPNVYREIDARTILSLVYENYKTPIFSHK